CHRLSRAHKEAAPTGERWGRPRKFGLLTQFLRLLDLVSFHPEPDRLRQGLVEQEVEAPELQPVGAAVCLDVGYAEDPLALVAVSVVVGPVEVPHAEELVVRGEHLEGYRAGGEVAFACGDDDAGCLEGGVGEHEPYADAR